MKPLSVIVVGGGVSGLTCGVRLLELGHRVSLLAEAMGTATTSGVAAALWFPYRAWPVEKVTEWGLRSLDRFRALADDPATGVAFCEVVEVLEGVDDDPGWRALMEGFRPARSDELAGPYRAGWALRLPMIESDLYLPYLERRFREGGGTIRIGSIRDWSELPAADAVVNCAGLGARQLCSDPALVPVRGQVLRASRGGIERAVVDEGGAGHATYVIPRSKDVVLGTTTEPGRANLDPDPGQVADIRQRCERLEPRTAALVVLEVKVGLRPGRPEVRVEAEQIGGRLVIHDYGHGGSGFTLSWGCAEEVANLLRGGPPVE
ncbi:MAG TPA: FAD-dependent oxidoreductase [Thermoanaerobaculia bacterium]|nr:FAD-dependent oxidoreductase [Thermoanaerobaculia bacterium]